MLMLQSVTTSSKAISHHLFRVKTDAKLAKKRLVEVMLHDENAFETESSLPDDSPSKSLKYSSSATIRGIGRQFFYLN
jgi:hypothetical protein